MVEVLSDPRFSLDGYIPHACNLIPPKKSATNLQMGKHASYKIFQHFGIIGKDAVVDICLDGKCPEEDSRDVDCNLQGPNGWAKIQVKTRHSPDLKRG